jgi:alkanesulfonate monooxygenase SsuD/methylene tetrahydromethanopterin reductase-like flavin-dependent oxidoreductase (luciferase family)
MLRRQLAEVELADRIGSDQIRFFEHHLLPPGAVPLANRLIAAASLSTRRSRLAGTVNICPSGTRCRSPSRRRCSTL